jgi:hypothetical protein
MFKVTCTLDWRLYVERFKYVDTARAFVTLVLGEDKYKWVSPTKIVAKTASTLTIECDELEKIMESTGKKPMPADIDGRVQKFLFGVWDGPTVEGATRDERGDPALSPRDKPRVGDGVSESLGEICKRNKWDERRARRALRASGDKKEGRWRWLKDEVPAIEARLREVFKT